MATAKVLGAAELMDDFDRAAELARASDTWVVGTNVEYSVYVEFGTYKMEAQPYLRPAARRAGQKAEQIADEVNSVNELVQELALEIERIAVRLVPVDTGNLQASIKAEKR